MMYLILIVKANSELVLNVCNDKGYYGDPASHHLKGYVPHVRSRGEEMLEKKHVANYKHRRWIVEVSHSWFNRFRKLLVQYEKTLNSYLA